MPAIRVDSTCPACSAGTFSNLIVMFGCSSSNSLAIFFISGWLPIHEKNVTSVGSVGSCTGPWPSPLGSLGASSPPQATRPKDMREAAATSASAFRDTLNLTESLLAPSERDSVRDRGAAHANRLAPLAGSIVAARRFVNEIRWRTSHIVTDS